LEFVIFKIKKILVAPSIHLTIYTLLKY